MKHFLISIICTLLCLFPSQIFAVKKEMVIAQMNSCVNTLTNIINNKSMRVLEHETDQLLNNLTMQQLVGLSEIADFIIELIDGIGKLEISEEERGLLKRLNSIKQDNLKWQVFSNALNNTMMITGGGNIGIQAGFQALVTAARAGVEYKMAQNEMQIEELQAMWELRKEDLKTFVELRKRALSIVFSLYQKYNLKESDRLTEQTSQLFQKIITDPDTKRMVRLLLDNRSKFDHLADYYYYLGMGYIDMNNIPKAMEAFNKYETLYNKAPIYRINEKSGIISLTRLAYLNNLSTSEIERELEIALKNLPSNTLALIQCAIVYDTVLKNPKKALSILRSALDDENTSDKEAIIITGSLILPKVSSKSQEHKDFLSAYSNQKTIDFDAALNICIANKHNIFKFLENNFVITELCYNPWFIGKAELNDEILISIPKRFSVDLSKIKMYVEKRKDDNISVTQYKLKDAKSITIESIEKIEAFKHNPNLKYLYMISIGNNIFKVKPNINYNSILKEDYPRQSEFTLTESDLKDIVEFLQKHEDKSDSNELIAEKIKTKDKSVKYKLGLEHYISLLYPISYQAYSSYQSLYKHFKDQPDASYIKFVFDDSRNLIVCYKFDKKNEKLIPCYTQYQGKIYFVNNSYLKAFGYAPIASKKVVHNKNTNKTHIKQEIKSAPQSKAEEKKNQPKQVVKSEKSWWKFWDSNEKPQKGTETKKAETKPQLKHETKSVQPKREMKKEQPKQETKTEKPWWKFWGEEESQTKTVAEKQNVKPQSNADVKKKQSKQDTKDEGPWWKFW